MSFYRLFNSDLSLFVAISLFLFTFASISPKPNIFQPTTWIGPSYYQWAILFITFHIISSVMHYLSAEHETSASLLKTINIDNNSYYLEVGAVTLERPGTAHYPWRRPGPSWWHQEVPRSTVIGSRSMSNNGV